MTPPLVARDVLLALGVAIELISYVGVLRASTACDRLHYLVPATAVAPPLIVAALVIDEGLSSGTVKALLIGLFLMLFSPVLSHATARAIRVRDHNGWTVLPGEWPDSGGRDG